MKVPDLEQLFYQGRYDDIIRSGALDCEGEANLYAVGALAFSGRLDEAEIIGKLLLGRDKDATDPSAVQARFFMCAGNCHAGLLDKAFRWARANVAALRADDPRTRFFAFQGLALVRYFEGRMDRCRRLTRRALASAICAAFPYGRLLALDLRGHALAQTGHVFAGIRLLAQASQLASDLGFESNSKTIDVAERIYRLRYRVPGSAAALSELEDLISSEEVSFFARRNGYLELCWQEALRGNRDRAHEHLQQAARIALPDSDRRGRTRRMLAHAVVLGLSQSVSAASVMADEACRLALSDPSLRVEVAFVKTAILRLADATPGELGELKGATGIARAAAACQLADANSANDRAPSEDAFAELLSNLQALTPGTRMSHLVHLGLYGLVPWSLGLRPDRRILLGSSSLLVEDHGNVGAAKYPSGPSIRVLRALASGPKSNEELLKSAWNIGAYSPSKHDATLHTAVARLRAALAPFGEWIVTGSHGYALDTDVQLLEVGEELVDLVDSSADVHSSLSNSVMLTREKRILEIVRSAGTVSSTELARTLRVSEATALRALRTLVQANKLLRSGRGKNTRYAVAEGGSRSQKDLEAKAS